MAFVLVAGLPFAFTMSRGELALVAVAVPLLAMMLVPVTRDWEQRKQN